MPRALKSLLALVGAAGMVVGAVVARGALDDKKVNDAIQVRLTCDPALVDACQKAAAADGRIKVTSEAPAKTAARLRGLASGADAGLDAWVTIGPWMAMTDGARSGQTPLGRSTRPVASTRIAIVERTNVAACSKPTPLGCGADIVRSIGIQSPVEDGVALAGAAWIVATQAGTPVTDLDRVALTNGPASAQLRELKARARPVGLEVVNASFANAQAIVTTSAAASGIAATRGATVPTTVSAVAEVAFLTDSAKVPLAADAPGRAALHDALVAGGWLANPEPSGLPDPGVLGALQEAWPSA
jgi:hypothetical protein